MCWCLIINQVILLVKQFIVWFFVGTRISPTPPCHRTYPSDGHRPYLGATDRRHHSQQWRHSCWHSGGPLRAHGCNKRSWWIMLPYNRYWYIYWYYLQVSTHWWCDTIVATPWLWNINFSWFGMQHKWVAARRVRLVGHLIKISTTFAGDLVLDFGARPK